MSETKHSTLPWRMSPWHIEEGPSAVRTGQYPNDYIVCTTASDEDAAFIVLATSLHHELVSALEVMIDEYDRNVCEHEITHRGGAIWTICEGCGRKWADDEGGFKPHCDPVKVTEARAVLAKAKQPKLEEPRG